MNPIVISRERKERLEGNLLLFFTGFSRYSSDIASSQQKATKDKTAELLEMLSLVDDAEKILTSKTDLNEFGRLLNYTWRLKRNLTDQISNDVINRIYKKAMEAGALGGKLMGAGGGGFIMFYVERDKQPYVRNALGEFLHVPFRFEDKGTHILYYTPEDYDIAKCREDDYTFQEGTL